MMVLPEAPLARCAAGRRQRTGDAGSAVAAWRRTSTALQLGVMIVLASQALCLPLAQGVTAGVAPAAAGTAPAKKASAAGISDTVDAASAASAERAALVEHRRLMLKILADEEVACGERFAVTACRDDVRRRRREALGPLRERELRLEEAERRARAEERRRFVAAKQAAAAERQASAAAPASAAALTPPPELRIRRPLGPAGSSSGAAPGGSSPASSGSAHRRQGPARAASDPAAAMAAREAEAAERVREAERRREQVEAARARIERRQTEREAAGRRTQPLPAPGAASQPR